MVEHIDKNRLNTDLRYRFDYLSKILDFTTHDIDILNQISNIIQPLIPVIVDNVYRKLFAFDITKQYLILRHSGVENSLPTDQCTGDFHSDGIEYRKNMLSKYLKRILTQQEWDNTFLQYLSYVGKIHTNQVGSSTVQVDYIHINILCGFIEQTLLNIVFKNDNLDQQTKHAATMAINKFFWIQNDFFRMHYNRDL